MKTDSDSLLITNPDRELSLSDIPDFCIKLNCQEKKQVEAELYFERKLTENLACVKCPDTLWKSVKKKLALLEKKLHNRNHWKLLNYNYRKSI